MSVRIRVRVTPRGGRDAVEGWSDDNGDRTLRVRLRATPADGAANDALVRLLAAQLGVPRSAVKIVSGASARTKLVEVNGASDAQLASLA